MAERLQRFDPSLLGTYAEHLVASHIGGQIPDEGWGPVDVIWRVDGPEKPPIEIQVKTARALSTFSVGTVPNVRFDMKASRSLHEVWAQKSAAAHRAQVWVFALHGGDRLGDGWRFFVAAGGCLDVLEQSTISLNVLAQRFGLPITGHRLAERVAAAAQTPNDDPEVSNPDWICGKCANSYATLRSLSAHQARTGHRLTAGDILGAFDDSTTDEASE